MKNRIVVSIMMICFAVMLSGCCLIHNWEAATCTTAKTCIKCGETEGDMLGHIWNQATCEKPKTCSTCGEEEGEPLGHQWLEATCAAPKTCSTCGETEGDTPAHDLSEANYQQASICKVCGTSVGEPLQADFEKYGMVCETQYDVPYAYTTHCVDNKDYIATGTVVFSNPRVFESDAMHEAEEGYEWRAVNVTFECSEVCVERYSWDARWCTADYYNIAKFEDSWNDGLLTVNHNGIDYDKCMVEYEFVDYSFEWGIFHCEYVFYARVPVGYDGIVYAFYDWDVYSAWEDDKNINDCANENTIYFKIN